MLEGPAEVRGQHKLREEVSTGLVEKTAKTRLSDGPAGSTG